MDIALVRLVLLKCVVTEISLVNHTFAKEPANVKKRRMFTAAIELQTARTVEIRRENTRWVLGEVDASRT